MEQSPKKGTKRKAAMSPSSSPAAKLGHIARGFHLQDRYSDLTIVCGDREYFARACDGNLKDRIHDTDPILVEKALKFLYTGDYTPDLTNYVPFRLASTSPDRERDKSSEEDTSNGRIPKAKKAEDAKGTDDMARFEPCFHVLMHEQGHYFQIQGLRRKARHHFRRTFLSEEPVQEPLVAVIYQVYRSRPVWDTLKSVMFATIINKAESVYKCNPIPYSIFRELPEFAQDFADAMLEYLARHTNRPSVLCVGRETGIFLEQVNG